MSDKRSHLIRPMVQSGKVMSNTHYFLLAPKPGVGGDRHSTPPLASVKPFNPRADHAQIHHSGKSTFFVGKSLLHAAAY